MSGLSGILFRNKMTNVFAENNVNRNSDSGKIVYKITLKALQDEPQCLQEDTIVTITSESYSAVGGIMRYYEENVKATIDAFYEMVNANPFKFTGNDLTALDKDVLKLKLKIALMFRAQIRHSTPLLNGLHVYLQSNKININCNR